MEQRHITKEEKVIRLLEYLKQYTDSRNPTSIPQMKRHFKDLGFESFFGNKNTLTSLVKEVARVMNSDVDGNLLPENEWRIVYDNFKKDFDPTDEGVSSGYIVNLYYKEPLRGYELDYIISSVKKDDSIDEEKKKELIKVLKDTFMNNNYGKRPLTPAQRRAEEVAKKRPYGGSTWLSRTARPYDYYDDDDEDYYY